MELTLAEEIRALLEMEKKSYPMAYIGDSAVMWRAFPALAAKMLAVIAERDLLRVSIEALPRYVVRINELEAQREQLLKEKNRAPGSAAARIAELKEDAVRWETRYRGAMDELTVVHDRGIVRDRARIDELEKAVASYKTIADANEWTMNLQIDKLNAEISRLRWEAECLQVTVR